AVGLVAVAAVLVGVVLRIAYLGADPSYPSWIGWLGDEGRWTQVGREWMLFGAVDLNAPLSRSHLILGPLFQAIQAVAFRVFGVGIVVARWVSVLAGLTLIATAWWFLRPRVGTWAAAVVVALLAVHPDLVFFSRVAIPEMASLALQLLGFALLVGAPRTRGRAFGAGVAVAVAMGLKGTVAPLLIVFMAVAVGTGRPGDPASRWSRCGLFVVPILGPALVFLLAIGATMGSLQGSIGDILQFAQLDSLYGAFSVLYVGEWTIRANVLLAALWSVGVALALSGAPDSEERTLFTGALIWAAGWIALSSVLLYFPERYVVHVHVPLVLALGAGLVLLRSQEHGLRTAIEGVARGRRRWMFAAAFVVPLAIQITAAGFSWAAAAGLSAGGMREHAGAVTLVTLLLATWLAARWSVGAVLLAGFALPLGMATAWSAVDLSGGFQVYWGGGAGDAMAWAWVFGAAIVGALLALRLQGPDGSRVHRLVLAYVGALAIVWVADRVDRLNRRTYALDEIRASLVDRYPEGSVIRVQAASSVLIDTRFRVAYPGWDGPAPDILLALENEPPYFDVTGYREVAEFGAPFGPRHYYDNPVWDRIRIYERVEMSPSPGVVVRPESP
ncbi:MAG: glycosyltransferase family 39 protein, partial [Gemmatimonadetes bacterium]|nr:glycosyltransferase family 39 protein [Gemmatimonadota bacterium]